VYLERLFGKVAGASLREDTPLPGTSQSAIGTSSEASSAEVTSAMSTCADDVWFSTWRGISRRYKNGAGMEQNRFQPRTSGLIQVLFQEILFAEFQVLTSSPIQPPVLPVKFLAGPAGAAHV
jgi:hypothetical protein